MLRGVELQAAAANSAIVQRFAVALLQPEAVLGTGPDDAENKEVVLDGAHLHLTAVLLHQLLTKPESFLATAGSGASLGTLLLTLIAADYMLVRTEFTEQLAARIYVLIRTTVLENDAYARRFVQALDAVQRVYAVSGQTDTELPLAMLQFARPLVDALLFCRQPWAQTLATHPVMRALAMCDAPDEAVTDVSTTWHTNVYGDIMTTDSDSEWLPPPPMAIDLVRHVDPTGLMALATLQLPQLTRLDLSYSSQTVSDVHVCPLLQQFGRTLQHVSMRGLSDGVTAATLWAVAHWCPGLEVLDARDCAGFRQTMVRPWSTQQHDAAAAVYAIVQQCFSLQTLLLTNSYCTTVDVLEALPQRAATLRQIGIDLLVVRLPPLETDETQYAYAERTAPLRDGDTQRNIHAVHSVRTQCTRMWHVECSGNHHDVDDYNRAVRFVPLDMVGGRTVHRLVTWLFLDVNAVGTVGWRPRSVRLRGGLSLNSMRDSVAIGPALFEFDARGPGVRDGSGSDLLTPSVSGMPLLQTLRVYPDQSIDMGMLVSTLSHQCTALTTLALGAGSVDDQRMVVLAQAQLPLTDLELSVSTLTGDGLRLLAANGVTTLVQLRLYDCPDLRTKGDDGLPWLVRHNPQLEVLHVGGDRTHCTLEQAYDLIMTVRDADDPVVPARADGDGDGDGNGDDDNGAPMYIARAPALRELALCEPTVRVYTYLADAYLRLLGQHCPDLHRLMLMREPVPAIIRGRRSGAGVTLAGLQALEQGCTRLQRVALPDAVFTAEMRKTAALAMPWVVWMQRQ